jgi:hypothetical protein
MSGGVRGQLGRARPAGARDRHSCGTDAMEEMPRHHNTNDDGLEVIVRTVVVVGSGVATAQLCHAVVLLLSTAAAPKPSPFACRRLRQQQRETEKVAGTHVRRVHSSTHPLIPSPNRTHSAVPTTGERLKRRAAAAEDDATCHPLYIDVAASLTSPSFFHPLPAVARRLPRHDGVRHAAE